MHPLDKIGVGDLRAEPHHRRGNLRIEEGFGDLAGMDRKQIEILPSRMHHFFDSRITHDLPERLQPSIRLDGRKIDDGGRAFRRDLNEFQLRHEAVFAHKFRIQCQPWAIFQLFAQLAQTGRTRNVVMWSGYCHRCITLKAYRVDPEVASVPYC